MKDNPKVNTLTFTFDVSKFNDAELHALLNAVMAQAEGGEATDTQVAYPSVMCSYNVHPFSIFDARNISNALSEIEADTPAILKLISILRGSP